MLNFTLSNYFNGAIINNIFLTLPKKYVNYLKTPIHINQISGTIPFNTWNGGYNINNENNIILTPDLSNLVKISQEASFRLNCANIFLNENDFQDNYHKVLLKAIDNGSTSIEITNLKCYDYLQQNYNFSKYILSENAVCLQPYTPEVINTILENTNFQFIQIPNIYREDFDFLSQIKDPSRLEICINPICPIYCQNYFQCIYNENLAQINFSNKTYFQDCIKTLNYKNNPQILDIDTLLEKYISLGINNFYLCTCPANDLTNYLHFLLYYFFQEEYLQEIINNEPMVQKILYSS